MSRDRWGGDWDHKDDDGFGEVDDSGSFEFYPQIDPKDGLIDTHTERRFSPQGEEDLKLRGPSEARLAQFERGFTPRKSFIGGTGGLAFGLQGFGRADWGNPTWRFYPGQMPEEDRRGAELAEIDDFDERGERLQEIAGETPEPLRPGHTAMFAPEASFYTDPLRKPWYDFTLDGGGWMPDTFDEILGGDLIPPERAILGNFAFEDSDKDDNDPETPEERARRKARAAERRRDPPNSELGIRGPRQRAAARRR